MNQKIVIVAATSTIAEHCARIWAKQNSTQFVLVGRDSSHLQEIAQDLEVRASRKCCQIKLADFENAESISNLVESIYKEGIPDIVLIAHGVLYDQNKCQNDLQLCKKTLEITGVSPVLFAEAFVNSMEKIQHGTLAIIGSVAGERGKRSNYIYGAAKSLIEHYVQGLQHRLSGNKIRIILVKPGPTSTKMTVTMKENANFAAPNLVAKDIITGINQGKKVIYSPKKWSIIMFVIRNLPNFIFKHLKI